MTPLVLASQSPRRVELLTSIGVPFEQFAVDIDESVNAKESPTEYVERLAIAKAKVALKRYTASEEPRYFLGSDTTVEVASQILGKPENEADFRRMMSLLSGNTHHVHTAVALVSQNFQQSYVVTSQVRFAELSDKLIAHYWRTDEPKDKAGGYGLQGMGAVLVEQVTGSFSNVIGLPLRETALLLSQADLPIWHGKTSL